MAARSDDNPKDNVSYYRSERLFVMNGDWYFSTREGDEGPFATRQQAEAALDFFVTGKIELAHFQKSREEGAGVTWRVKRPKLEVLPLEKEVFI